MSRKGERLPRPSVFSQYGPIGREISPFRQGAALVPPPLFGYTGKSAGPRRDGRPRRARKERTPVDGGGVHRVLLMSGLRESPYGPQLPLEAIMGFTTMVGSRGRQRGLCRGPGEKGGGWQETFGVRGSNRWRQQETQRAGKKPRKSGRRGGGLAGNRSNQDAGGKK